MKINAGKFMMKTIFNILLIGGLSLFGLFIMGNHISKSVNYENWCNSHNGILILGATNKICIDKKEIIEQGNEEK